MSKPEKTSGQTIAFQGAPGAYSEMACLSAYPEMTTLPTGTFADTFGAVRSGKAALAMIPLLIHEGREAWEEAGESD